MGAENTNGWKKPLLVLLPFAIAGLVGWGVLKSDVAHLHDDVEAKATRETVQAQYDAIVQRLDRIERKIDERPR